MSRSYLVCVPSIHQPYTDDCLASMSPGMRANTLVVDNTVTNRGVPASWNVGAAQVLNDGLDWLVICSAAMRFGSAGGDDFTALLGALDDAWLVEAGPGRVERYHGGEHRCGIGWHLIAVHRRTLETVGLFDTAFGPAYMEDNDYSWRVRIAACRAGDGDALWPKVDCDAWVGSQNHGEKLGRVVPQAGAALSALYNAKWGGSSGHEQYARPFNRPDSDIREIGHTS